MKKDWPSRVSVQNKDLWYFGYGPIVNDMVRKRRGIETTQIQPAYLPDYRLTFSFGGLANIVKISSKSEPAERDNGVAAQGTSLAESCTARGSTQGRCCINTDFTSSTRYYSSGGFSAFATSPSVLELTSQ